MFYLTWIGLASARILFWTFCVLALTLQARGGTVEVLSGARFSGDYGLKVTLEGFSLAFVEDGSPEAETHYRARFFINTGDVQLSDEDAFDVFAGYDGLGSVQFRLEILKAGGTLFIRGLARLDEGGFEASEPIAVAAGYHLIEMEWMAGDPAGAMRLWVNEAEPLELSLPGNGSARIEWVRLGSVNGIDPTAAGSLAIDDFVSNQGDPIGPLGCNSIFQYQSALAAWEMDVTVLIQLLNEACFL